MQQFLIFNCLKECRALPRRRAVIPPTEEAGLWPLTDISGVRATASPTTDFAIAGDVSVAKHEAISASKDGEGVSLYLIHSAPQGHPLGDGSPKFDTDSHIWNCLVVCVVVG